MHEEHKEKEQRQAAIGRSLVIVDNGYMNTPTKDAKFVSLPIVGLQLDRHVWQSIEAAQSVDR